MYYFAQFDNLVKNLYNYDMKRFSYELKTNTYTASGEVDAVDEDAAKEIIKEQVKTPRKQGFMSSENFEAPTIKSLKLTFMKSV